ncbi:hypothetical protein VO64_4055 [Pseudomonas synxantha]|uniref:Uncharacterized protein n=1 Tax=Pseudomonas synxantha TaxID=47883 RepID=A0AAU8TR31_9PSED|nr:hypothetical protein VO64_4055 [Pseudomonas synxantha]
MSYTADFSLDCRESLTISDHILLDGTAAAIVGANAANQPT